MKIKGLLDVILAVIAIIVIILSLINIFINISKIPEFIEKLTGYASGYVNISISSQVVVNLTVDSLNWGSGVVSEGNANATLITHGNNSGTVLRGNWSGNNAKAFVAENIGNVNSSLFLYSEKNASSFFESLTNSNQELKFNVSDKESNSCSGISLLGSWADVNTTSPGTKYCSQFDYHKNSNEIYIDVFLSVPYDAGNTGPISDVITIGADTAG